MNIQMRAKLLLMEVEANALREQINRHVYTPGSSSNPIDLNLDDE